MTSLDQEYDHLTVQYQELLRACRVGDLSVISRLIEVPGIDINKEDDFGYTPLYLASLCGHIDVVEFLLFNGAECDRDTHVGARCVYGALNDRIRNLLIGFNLSKGFDASQPFSSHISNILNMKNYISGKDVLFKFDVYEDSDNSMPAEFKLNRFLLAARSDYFKRQLLGPWKNSSTITLDSSVDPKLFIIIADFIYVKNVNLLNVDRIEELRMLAARFELYLLAETIDKIVMAGDYVTKSKINHNSAASFVVEAKNDLKEFLNGSIVPHKVYMHVEQDCLPEDMAVSQLLDDTRKQKLLSSAAIPDIILAVHDEESSAVEFYPSHKNILSRSEYFKSMFNSRVFEGSLDSIPWLIGDDPSEPEVIDRTLLTATNIPVVHLSFNLTNHCLAKSILSFMYHDGLNELHPMEALDLYFAADELFLDKLKTFCTTTIVSSTSKFNFEGFENLVNIVGYDAFELVQIAWETNNDRLEQHISKILANSLLEIYSSDTYRQGFSDLIQESADRLSRREATDTIELVDDIRFYLARKYPTADSENTTDFTHLFEDSSVSIDEVLKSLPGFERDSLIIEIMLNELGLEC